MAPISELLPHEEPAQVVSDETDAAPRGQGRGVAKLKLKPALLPAGESESQSRLPRVELLSSSRRTQSRASCSRLMRST